MDFIRFRIHKKIRETHRAVTLQLEPLDGPISYQAGQFLTFLFQSPEQKSYRRSYSLSSAPGIDHRPAITVKRTVNGQASRFLTEQSREGDILQALPPAGKFVLPPANGARDIFLIGGGSGITPLFGIIKWALKNEPQSRITLIQSDSGTDSIIFRKELNELAQEHPKRLKNIHILSQDDEDIFEHIFPPAIWVPGRLSNAMVEDLVTKNLQHNPKEAQFFLCGPEGLMLKSRQTLRFMGYEDEQIHREIFVVKNRYIPPADLFPDSQVDIDFKGQSIQLEVKAGQTILEAALSQDIDLPYSCRTGVCTICSGQCLEGEVQMHTQIGLMNSKTSKGLILTCTGYPITEKVKMVID
ncbi:MAG: ferredoxin--NADP reductase [Bacteroidetes bacterium]|nr:ferredoxin--NADP reductase [Bacteroidota bacterium]